MAKHSTSAAGATRATIALTKLGIAFTPHEYAHDPRVTDFGGGAASALGAAPERVFKTLLAEVEGSDASNALVVAIVPVSGRLDLKALASAAGGKRARMAEPALAERKTGYVIGGISPIGQRGRLPTLLDASAQHFDTVLVSGGRRGLDIELSPADLITATGGRYAEIARVL